MILCVMQDRAKIQKKTPFFRFCPPALRGSFSFLLEIYVKYISHKKEFRLREKTNLSIWECAR